MGYGEKDGLGGKEELHRQPSNVEQSRRQKAKARY